MAANWIAVGDDYVLWGGPDECDRAVSAYDRAAALAPENAVAQFRLGVAYRARFESPSRRGGDFQRAVDAWGRALSLKPNQYIWRRRIQQYGPRLDKPYPFYDSVDPATAEIAARGEKPVALSEPP